METANQNTFNQATLNNEKPWFDYMDNLRALALILGVFFHASLAYSPLMYNLWPAADTLQSTGLDAVAWFIHLFRMPLFFLISGFFAYMLMQRRGLSDFMKNRSMRILLPFVIFLPLVIASFIYSLFWAVANVENPSPLLTMLESVFNNSDSNAEQPPFSTAHLWFLFNLFLFCCLAALCWKFKLLQSARLDKLLSTKFIIIILPLLLIPALASVPTPHPAAERIYPEPWSFGYYGVFFFLGLALYRKQSLIEQLKPYALGLFIISVMAYAYLFLQIYNQPLTIEQMLNHQFSWDKLPIVVIEAYVSVYMTVCCLVFGKQFLNFKNALLRVLSQSSYWIYIVHLPVLFVLQYWLLDVELGLWTKFLIGSFGTLAIGMASYFLLVKWTPIGWLLNGKKKK